MPYRRFIQGPSPIVIGPRPCCRLCADRIEAPGVINGPINGKWCLAYSGQLLVLTLKPGYIVVTGNLASRKGTVALLRVVRVVQPGEAEAD